MLLNFPSALISAICVFSRCNVIYKFHYKFACDSMIIMQVFLSNSCELIFSFWHKSSYYKIVLVTHDEIAIQSMDLQMFAIIKLSVKVLVLFLCMKLPVFYVQCTTHRSDQLLPPSIPYSEVIAASTCKLQCMNILH